jgi:hypothetical protein
MVFCSNGVTDFPLSRGMAGFPFRETTGFPILRGCHDFLYPEG